jgi:hypothetical protein
VYRYTTEVRRLAQFVPCAAGFSDTGYAYFGGYDADALPHVVFNGVDTCRSRGHQTVSARYLLSTGHGRELYLSEPNVHGGSDAPLRFEGRAGVADTDLKQWGYTTPVALHRGDGVCSAGDCSAPPLRLSPLFGPTLDKLLAEEKSGVVGQAALGARAQVALWGTQQTMGPLLDKLLISPGASFLSQGVIDEEGWHAAFEAVDTRPEEPLLDKFCESTAIKTDKLSLRDATDVCKAKDGGNRVVRYKMALVSGGAVHV